MAQRPEHHHCPAWGIGGFYRDVYLFDAGAVNRFGKVDDGTTVNIQPGYLVVEVG